jgi:hypothetical protein
MTAIGTFLKDNLSSIIPSLLILLVGVVAWIRLRGKLIPVEAGMEQALAILMKETRSTVEGFAAEFEDFDAVMRKHDILAHSWSEFRKTLILPASGERLVIKNVVDASAFFNVSSILGGRVNLRFYREVPNYLPGLGILGTFLGLTIGIYGAKSHLTSGVEAETLTALTNLLNGAALAFLTSIAGLVGSLGYSTLEKRRIHYLEKQIDVWCDALDARLERVTLEHLSSEHLHQAKQQTIQLQRFNTDLAISITAALDETLANRFAPLMGQTLEALDALRRERREGDSHLVAELAPILHESVDAIRALRSDKHDTNVELLKGMAQSFKETLTASAGGEMDAIARTLQDLTAELKGAAGTISGAGANAGRDLESATRAATEHLHHSMVEMVEMMAKRQADSEAIARETSVRLEAQMGKIASALETAAGDAGSGLRAAAQGAGADMREAANAIGTSAAGVVSDMQKASSGFATSVERLSAVTGDSERTANLTRSTISELQETVILLDNTLKTLRDAGEPLSAAGRALADQMRMQEKAIATLAGYSSVLEKSAANVEESSAALGESWVQVNARYTGLDDALKKSFIEINDGVQAFGASVQGFIQKLDASLSQSMGLLSGAISELNDVVEDLASKK